MLDKNTLAILGAYTENEEQTEKQNTKIYQHKKEIKAFQFTDGDVFMKKPFPETNWIIEEILPEGLALLIADPKSGKSFLTLLFALSVISGENLFKRFKTKKCDVLLISYEDINRRMQKRINRLKQDGIGNIKKLKIIENLETLSIDGVERLRQTLLENPQIKLVIIDTYQRAIANKKSTNKNAYAEQYDFLGAFQSLAGEMHACILFVHHTNKKESDDPFGKNNGTQGMTGATDVNMLLESRGERFGENKEANLYITGKDVEEKKLHLIFEKETCTWKENENYTNEPNTTPERKQILDLFGNDYNKVLKSGEISSLLGKKNVSTLLSKLVKEGYLSNEVYGEYKLKIRL